MELMHGSAAVRHARDRRRGSEPQITDGAAKPTGNPPVEGL
jgi:hypothetical protein